MSQDLHTVRAVFTFKDSESKSKFVDFCNGEKGLSVARNWPGCHLFEFYQLDDNTNLKSFCIDFIRARFNYFFNLSFNL